MLALGTAPITALVLALTADSAPITRAPHQGANEPRGREPGPDVAFRTAVRGLCEQLHLTELTADSLQPLVADPAIRGAQAAALAAIVRVSQVGDAHDAISCERLAAGQAANEQQLANLFHQDLLALQHANRAVFATGHPDFSKLQQGHSGDCYFFSVTGWMALNRPEVVRAAVQSGAGSTYEVRVPGSPPTAITAPTDAELCFTSGDTLSDGIWVPILMKAWGEHLVANPNTNHNPSGGSDPVVAASHGGSEGAAIRWWTGHNVHAYSLLHTSMAEFRQALVNATTNHLAATLGTSAAPPVNLPKHHIQALLGFDSERNMLRIWNPWGDNFTPHGEPGPQNGYPRQHGVFEIPLDVAHRGFSSLVVEVSDGAGAP